MLVQSGGDACPGNVRRSVVWEFLCGEEDRVVADEGNSGVHELETCVYTVRAETPAACDDGKHHGGGGGLSPHRGRGEHNTDAEQWRRQREAQVAREAHARAVRHAHEEV